MIKALEPMYQLGKSIRPIPHGVNIFKGRHDGKLNGGDLDFLAQDEWYE